MPVFLKQSTAVDVALGPFLDATDGVTAETGLTIAQADVRLKKNNGAWAQVNDATSAAHEENGWYEKELDATDTNTVGRLLIAVHESGALPVWHEFWVLEEAIYDALFAASAAAFDSNQDVTVGSIAAGAITAAAIATGAIDADAIADNAIDAGALAADCITAAKIATGAIDADAIAADAITAAKVAADVSAEIADAVWDEDATGHQTGGTFGQAIGDPGADTNTIFKAVVTDASGATVGADSTAILADTNELQTDWVDGGRLDLIVDAILTDTGTTLQGEVDGIQADTEDIQARLPAALTAGGNIKADVLAISGDTTAADRLEGLMDGTIIGQVNDASATTTVFIADGFTEATDDHFIGRLITFISGALSGQQTAITDYTGATQTFTVDALTEAPADDVFFCIH